MYQQTLFDYTAPDYKDSKDEIVRLHAERLLENAITLRKCCGVEPKEYFRSCHEYFVICPVCGAKTKMCKKSYLAMQDWNKEVLNG